MTYTQTVVPRVVAALTCLAIGGAAHAEPPKNPPASQPTDPASGFIADVDQSPRDKRPPNWEAVKKLMARKPPAVGEAAPDFTLKTQDGRMDITRSKQEPGRPQVLIFGSFT